MTPTYYICEYKTILDKNQFGYKEIRSYLVDRDDYGDCLKNVWKVVAEKTNGELIELNTLANKLPTYSNSTKEIEQIVKKHIDMY